MTEADCPVLADALERKRALGTKEFFLRGGEMRSLVQHLLGQHPDARLSLNNTHSLGCGFLHRAELMGLRFISVSVRPLLVR
jgi:hypothetical protein